MDREVEAVLRPPLPVLLDPETHAVDTWTLHGREVEVPYYDIEGRIVWGATAMMLSELLNTVDSIVSPSD